VKILKLNKWVISGAIVGALWGILIISAIYSWLNIGYGVFDHPLFYLPFLIPIRILQFLGISYHGMEIFGLVGAPIIGITIFAVIGFVISVLLKRKKQLYLYIQK
jgi:hypothetical protein